MEYNDNRSDDRTKRTYLSNVSVNFFNIFLAVAVKQNVVIY